MAIEAGGKNGIFPVDEKAAAYMKEHSLREFNVYEADEDAVYDEEYTIDLSELKPTIAFPHLPENTKTIDEITEDVVIDQSVIGSCTNGRIDDLRIAAEILKGRKVKKGVRCIVIPATQKIYLQAMEEGLLKIFIESGIAVAKVRQPADLVWAAIWGFWPKVKDVYPRQTVTLSGRMGARGIRGISGESGCCSCEAL